MIIILIIVAGLAGYVIGSSQHTSVSALPLYTTTTQTVFTNSCVPPTCSSTTETITRSVLNSNNSISNIIADNMTVGPFPGRTGVNPVTDMVYIPYYNKQNSSIAVIDGRTNKVVATIANLQIPGTFLLVNSRTNMLYIGNLVINGSTNKVSASIESNMTFVALDESANLLFAVADNSSSSGLSSRLYEINGTTNSVIDSQTLTGSAQIGNGAVGEVALDNITHTIYLPVCTVGFSCSPTYVYALYESGLAVVAKIPINQFAVFAIVVDDQTNMIFVTASQNLLIVINGTTNQIVGSVPISAYANQLRNMEIDPSMNELFITGSPNCQDILPDCGVGTLYVISTQNYGLLAFFSTGKSGSEPIYLAFNPANNETYMSFSYSDYVLAVKVPQFQISILVP